MMRSTRLLAALLLAAAPAAATAQLTQAFTPAGLGAGSFTTHDFETTAGGPGATYTSADVIQRFAAAAASGGVTTSGAFGLLVRGSNPLTITFAAPTRAVGLYFGNDDFGRVFPAVLEAFNGAVSLGSVSVTSNANDFVDQFLGFTSTTDVTSVVLEYTRPAAGGLFPFIDDVQFGVSAVPEPATVLLLGAGLLTLAGVARRRSA